MFDHPTTSSPHVTAGRAAALSMRQVPPRARLPFASSIVAGADKRTRQLAEAMIHLNAEDLRGCTETTLQLEGFSLHEQAELGPTARALANTRFVRQAQEAEPHPSDDELLAAALKAFSPLTGLGSLVRQLRADPDYSEDVLGRIWPRIATGAASLTARAALPPRMDGRA